MKPKTMEGKMKKKEHECECHKIINGRVTCDLTCLKCSHAKEVNITETKDYKRIEVIF